MGKLENNKVEFEKILDDLGVLEEYRTERVRELSKFTPKEVEKDEKTLYNYPVYEIMSGALIWSDTKKGHDFWNDIDTKVIEAVS